MALTDENSNGMVMPVSPMGFGGNGNSFGFCGDWSWILILFLFGMFGGWGGMGGFGGMGGYNMDVAFPWLIASNTNTDNLVNAGFNQAATAGTLSGIQSSISSGVGDIQLGIAGINQNVCQTGSGITNAINQGFAGTNLGIANSTSAIQNSLCNGFNGVNQGISNGFAQAEISNNARQMANMQQAFNAQTAMASGLNGLSSQFADCCCENRLASADLKYTVATEACNDRAALSDAMQGLTMQNVTNTNALLGTIRDGIQSIKDDLCADRLDAERRKSESPYTAEHGTACRFSCSTDSNIPAGLE